MVSPFKDSDESEQTVVGVLFYVLRLSAGS